MDPKDKFNKQMTDLWHKYLEHCAETHVVPATRDQFAISVQEKMAQIMAHEIADKEMEKFDDPDDGKEALYVAMRVKDLPAPARASKTDICGQCGEKVWVDPTMHDRLKHSKAIICNACLPEVTGHTREEIIKEKLDEHYKDKG